MSFSDFISYSLWIVGAAGQLLTLIILVRRKLVREFPAFAAYIAFHVLLTGLSAVLLQGLHLYRTPAYFYVYWTGQAMDGLILLAVIYEIFCRALQPYEALQKVGAILFRWSGAVLIVIAIVVAALMPGTDSSRLSAGILVLDRSVSVVQCGLVVFLFLFSSLIGLTWRHQVVGIALGFGTIASMELAAAALRTQFGPAANLLFDFVRRGSYDSAALIWIAYLLRPEPERIIVQSLPESDLAEWNRALLQLLYR